MTRQDVRRRARRQTENVRRYSVIEGLQARLFIEGACVTLMIRALASRDYVPARGCDIKDAGGRPVRDAVTFARIKALVIPPAWTDVWICPWPDGHIQATGRDARGRKQYRYHTLANDARRGEI